MRMPFAIFVVSIGFVGAGAVGGTKQPWYFASPKTGEEGIALDEAYGKLSRRKPLRQVVVAVIDSGVDPRQRDLIPVFWTNSDEIPSNGIDDDNNGLVDDIHGWNFVIDEHGHSQRDDSLSITRRLAQLRISQRPTPIEMEEQAKLEEEVGKERASTLRRLAYFTRELAAGTEASRLLTASVGGTEAAALDKASADSRPDVRAAAATLGG